LPPTQSSIGEYIWIKEGDTVSTGFFFLVPPMANFITINDTVEALPFDTLRNPWFTWWIMGNPIRYPELYDICALGESLSDIRFDLISKNPGKSNVRVAFDKNIGEPISALFYWPKSAGHGFPGADAVYYDFSITDHGTLCPNRTAFLNRANEPVEIMIFINFDGVARTPPDDGIIAILMAKLKESRIKNER
jgi:hypothetical protein